MTSFISDICTTLLAQLLKRWDYTTAGVLADAFAENDDPYNAALWYVLAEPYSDTRRLAYAAECEREVERECGLCEACQDIDREVKKWMKHWVASRPTCKHCSGTGTIFEPRVAARAEFVRVQVELNQLISKTCKRKTCHGGLIATNQFGYRRCRDCKRRWDTQKIEDLRRRERELRGHLKVEGMIIGMENRFGGDGCTWEWHRGFISQITCSAADWLAHGPEIRLCQPVECVKLTTRATTLFTADTEMIYWQVKFPGIAFELPTDYNPAFDYVDASIIDL